MRIPVFKAYIFDVDGTLVDSAPDICGAVQDVLRRRGHHGATDAQITRLIGRHLVDIFGDVIPECPSWLLDEMIAEYRQIYPLRKHSSTIVYPGVIEGLRRLPGLKSTATTKATSTTQVVLEQFGLKPYFHHVQGTDGFPCKPAPDVIFAAIKGLGVAPEDCLMVGDATSDMEAARKAGVKSCAVTYGYGTREALSRWSPDYWVTNLVELSSHSA